MNRFFQINIILFFCFFLQYANAQVTLTVRINSGNSATSCTDGFFGGAPEPQWRVNVANQGWTTYPQSGICFTNPPNTQFSQTYDCQNNYPANIQVCFRAFEDDGAACIVSESCLEQICQNYPTPAPGTSTTHTLSITTGTSTGSVNFTITASGGFTLPGGAYDQICNAINLGTLNSGASVGNDGLSNRGNFCAGNAGDPNPWGGSNNQGVWFTFTTGPTPSTTIRFNAVSDPQGLGDGLDLQLALYTTSNSTCTGALSLVRDEYEGLGTIWDEEMFVDCMQPNTTYFLLVDGENSFITGSNGQQGFFGLEIYDNGIVQAGDRICRAQHLGTVPAGGSVGTPNLSQSNICATNTGDPTPGSWSPDKSVWYSFVTPPSGHVIINAESDLPFPIGDDAVDLQLALYSTNNNLCTGTLQLEGDEYSPILFDEDLDIRCLDPNRIYYILVDGSALNVDGIFDITVNDGGIPPAPNDSICNAIALGAPAPNGTVGLNNQNNYCADNLFEPIPQNFGNDQGVWYTFIAPPSGKVEIRLESAGFFSDRIDLQVAVYDAQNQGCSDPLSEIHSEYEGFGLLWDETAEVECLVPGRLYYIMVDGQGSLINPDLQEGIFDIEVWADPRDPAGPNDLPCNAIPLGNPSAGQIGTTPGPQHGSQNNFCATAVGEPTPSGFTPTQTVWYTFVAPPSGSVRIQGFSDNQFGGVDPIYLSMAVWETPGCNGPFREVISGRDLIPIDIDLEVFCLKPGETYYLQVDGSPPALLLGWHEGYFDITINEIPPIPVAPNNQICNATALGDPFAAPVTLTNQNNLCADDLGDPQPAAFGTDQTVWYTFTTPPTGGPYAVDIDATTGLPWPFGNGSIDLQVAVYGSSNNSCTGTLTEIESEYDIIFFDESVRVQCLQPNSTYFIMIDGSFLDPQGYFDLTVTQAPGVPIPTNDLICNFEDLGTIPVGGSVNNNINYSNFCADIEPGEPSPFGIDQTVWFSFIAPLHTGANATSEVTVRVESDPNNVGDAVDLQLAVYESGNGLCTGSMSLVRDGSDDPLFSFDGEVNLTCLVPGNRYYVQVDGTLLNIEGYFTISVADNGSGFHPPYDTICNAVALGAVPNGAAINNGVVYTNLCATTQPGEPNPAAFNPDQSVWFTFQTPASGNVTIDLFSNGSDAINLQMAVYQAQNNSCNGPWLEIDSDYDGILFDESMTLECLVPNTTYYLQVDGEGNFGGDEGNFTIRIEDDGGSTVFPYNNDICNAFNFGLPGANFTALNNESNECANLQFGEPGVGSYANHTVWYQFTAPPSARVEIEVESTNPVFGVDPEVYVFSSSNNGCTGTFNEVESSNLPTAIITENIEANCLVPGNTYFIQVDGSNLTQEGTFNIRIRDMEPLYGTGLPGDPEPANNLCANAISIPVQSESCANGNGSWNTYNYGQPTAEQATSCGQNCGETWYSFTMPSSGIALVEGNDDGIGGGFPFGDFSDLRVVAYTGSCGNLSQINCGSGGLLNDVGFEVAAAPGSTVFLQVFNNGGDDDEEDFELCVSEGCGADNCLNATAFPIQPNIPYCFNTAAAGGENVSGGTPGYFECGEGDNPEHSIYYYFVSDCNGSAVTLNVINATASGGCIFGIIPDDGFNISFFQDPTPCDNNPAALVDCQNFSSCMVQPINWSFTYNNLQPNTPYIIQIDGGFNFLGGDNSGYIMIQTTTNPVVIPTTTPAGCNGGGTATATVLGGVAPFTFLWSNGATDSIATNLAPGNYTVTVTSAAGTGCTDTATVNIVQPISMSAAIINSTIPLCSNSCDGSATVQGTGGTLTVGYTYLWDNNASSQVTQTATGLCPGNYSVTVFDNGGCSATATVTIGSSPNAVTATLVSTIDALCAGVCNGQGTVAGSGGSVITDYNYLWPNGQTTALGTGLCAGTFTVTVSDRFGCAGTIDVTINQPLSVIASIANQTDVSCNGGSTGSFEILATNGTVPYTYDIGNGFGASNTFTGLAAGNYSVTVQDNNGCRDDISVTLIEPTLISAFLLSSVDESCFGASDGSFSLSASGGNFPYQFSLDGINFSNSATFNNLTSANYNIIVRDANNCTITIPAQINSPSLLILNLDNQTDAGCGVCDGTATVIPGGGVGGYTFLWSDGQIAPNATGLCAGNNIVTLTDANNCSTTFSVTINNTAGLLSSNTLTQPSCFGNCDGQISVSPQGGNAPFNFLWNDGQTTSTATNLCTGGYTVTITDVNGCFIVENINLSQPNALSTLAAQLQQVSCNGSSDGRATATPSGGTAPYNYLWDNNEVTQTSSGLNAGVHSVSVTDNNGCEASATVTIGSPAAFSVNIVNTTTSDCGTSSCNGSAQISVSGGLAPYSYLWSNGSTTASVVNLCPNFNDITVTDANGCTSNAAVNIASNSTLGLIVQNVVNPFCFSNCNGSATVQASGGNTSSPYIFTWSNGSTTNNISGLCDGTYRVTVSDIDACTNALEVTITEPSALSVTAVIIEPVSCFGASDGSVTANVSGGTVNYSFLWSNGLQTQVLNNLNAATYSVTVTDNNGCTANSSITLNEPSAISLTINSTQISCFGFNNGSATANASGGTGTLTYLWSNNQTTAQINNLSPAVYNLTVTDQNACSVVSSVAINTPPLFNSNFSFTNPSCFGLTDGDIDLNVNGSNPPFIYSWSNGEVTEDLFSLGGGVFNVTVTDQNNCSISNSVTLTQPSAIQILSLQNNVSCNALNNGSIDLTVSGGNPAYDYNWSNGSSTQDLSGLNAGIFTVSVTDNNLCFSQFAITITEPSQLTVNATQVNVNCFGANNGSVNLTVNGGTGPYRFNWSNGRTTEDISLLSASVYTVTISDASNCSITNSVTITEPSVFNTTIAQTPVSCFGGSNGSVNLTVNGGTAPLSFNWSNGRTTEDISGLVAANYSVTVTDQNNCQTTNSISVSQPAQLNITIISGNLSCFGLNNGTINLTTTGGTSPYSYIWSNAATTEDISGLSQGSYSVTITDNSGCSVTRNANINSPTAITSSVNTISVNCFGGNNGNVNLTVSGGNGPYTYQWSNGRTTEDISALTAATYSVIIRDNNSCTATASATVTQPNLLTASANLTQIVCSGTASGAIDLQVSGGNAPYNYSWSTGAITQDISGLSAGSYSVTVRDANNCSTTFSSTLTSPPALTLSLTSTAVTCRFGSDGTIISTVNGGVAPYSYSWSNGLTTANAIGLSAGIYTLTVSDSRGCSIIGNSTVTQPSTGIVARVLSITNNNCSGNALGSIDADAFGGTPNYTFQWSNGASTEDLTGLIAGTYTLTATDQIGCSAVVSAVITQPTALNGIISQYSNFNGSPISCFGASDGAIRVTANGGVQPYTFLWSTTPNQNSQLVSGLSAGNYTVTITDANNCQITRSFVVTQPVQLAANFQQTNVSCHGNCNGIIIANAVSGTGTLGINGYEYRILGPGQPGTLFTSQNNFTGLCAGTYTVEVRDGNNCVVSRVITITEPALLTANIQTQNPSCNGSSNGTLNAIPNGGTAPFSFSWSNGRTGQNISNITAGTYRVTITDNNGCFTISSAILTEPNAISVTVNINGPSCNGSSDASATAVVSGGTAPYRYLWSNGGQLATTFSLGAGSHSVTITDAQNCTRVQNFNIQNPATLTATFSVVNPGCFGANNGAVTAVPNGGVSPYTYLWNNGQTNATATGLAIGSYSVLISDAGGCQITATVQLTQPNPVNVFSVSSTNPSCFGGSNGTATVSASGGTSPYNFVWSNGQITATATGLSANNYTVTVTDNNGCSANLSVNIAQPSQALITAINPDHVSCKGGNDGSASVVVNMGGTFPYQFNWSNGGTGQAISNLSAGTYFVSLTDGNGCVSTSSFIINEPASFLVGVINNNNALCNGSASGQMTAVIGGGTLIPGTDYNYLWSNGATTAIVSGITSGAYSLTVTDANGCTLSLSTVVGQASNLTINIISSQDALCEGGIDGTATVIANGGTGSLNFQWSTGQTSLTATGLSAGNYTVTVTDANGCSISTSVQIGEGEAVELTTDIQNISCFGARDGSLNVSSAGASLYFWSTGHIGNPLSNLGPGEYSLTVQMASGCIASFSYNITEPELLVSNIQVINQISCNNAQDASISAEGIGGTPQYQYNWSNGSSNQTNSGLPSGSYTLTLTDANGCKSIRQITLNNPAPLQMELSAVDVRCIGDRNGLITVSASGGTIVNSFYEFSLDSIEWQSGDLFPNLAAGNYEVYVRDVNGCTLSDSVLVGSADSFMITFMNPVDTTIEFGDTIRLSAMVNDSSDASVFWLNLSNRDTVAIGAYNVNVGPVNATVYQFTAVSPMGCEVDSSVRILVRKERIVGAAGGFTPNGDGINDNFFIQGNPKVKNVLVFRVFDRWGEMVYEGQNLRPNVAGQGWDGTFKGEKMNSGVYAWYAEVEFIDGQRQIIKGDVTLLR